MLHLLKVTCTYESQMVGCVGQTISKSVVAAICKDYKIVYMSVERKDPLSDSSKKKAT